jgi:hypothetical protein
MSTSTESAILDILAKHSRGSPFRQTTSDNLAETIDNILTSDFVARKICAEIQEIMRVYREQEATRDGVGTPGGLEHMGDVWRLLRRWDTELGLNKRVECSASEQAAD